MGRYKSGNDWITGYRFIGRKKKLEEYLVEKFCPVCGKKRTLKEIDFVRTNDIYDSTTGRENEPEGWKIYSYSCGSHKVSFYTTQDGNRYYQLQRGGSDNSGVV